MANVISEDGLRVFNGWTIIGTRRSSKFPSDTILLAFRANPHFNEGVEYVTALVYDVEKDQNWAHGHYSAMHFPAGIEAAVKDFVSR